MKSNMTPFVKKQKELKARAEKVTLFHGSFNYMTSVGSTYDPFNKLEKAWDAWKASRKARNDARKLQLAISRGKTQ